MIPGKYKARATAAGLSKAKTGTWQVIVTFQIADSDETINWYGYFTPRAMDRTIESIMICGYKGADPFVDFAEGNLEGLGSKDVELVIEDELDQDGTPRTRVRWVNAFRGSGIPVLQPEDRAEARAAGAKAAARLAEIRKLQQVTSGSKSTRPTPAARQTQRQVEPIEADIDDTMPF